MAALITAGFRTHGTCRLTAKNRAQLRNPTLGSRVQAIFTFLSCMCLQYILAVDEGRGQRLHLGGVIANVDKQ